MIITPYEHIHVASQLAQRVHIAQTDKAGQPYILHVERVAQRVIDIPKHRLGGPHAARTAITAAYLHDTVEDTYITLDLIEFLFGTDVETAVDAVTRRGDETYDDFIRRAKLHPIGRIIKLADVQDNLSRPASLTPLLLARYETALHILTTNGE